MGDNQAETRPVYFGMVNDWRVRNGAKLVVVDPRRTVTASKADRWLPIRPGTDMALGLALCHDIFTDRREDQDFCADWVEGVDRWRQFILAKGYSPEWASPITGLKAADIRRLSHELSDARRAMIFGSRGLNQHTNATQTNRVFMFLAAITGHWGRPGAGYMNMSMSVPIVADAPPERQATIRKPQIRKSPTGWISAMREGAPYPLEALIACNNPPVSVARSKRGPGGVGRVEATRAH